MLSPQRYLRILLSISAFFVSVVALVNYIVDPYWQYDFAPHNAIQGLNHQVSDSALGLTYSSLMVTRQQLVLSESKARTAIIGSSRSMHGVNTCQLPNVQKVGVYGIEHSQALLLIEAALSNQTMQQVLVETSALLTDSESLMEIDVKENIKEGKQHQPKGGLLSTRIFLTSVYSALTSWKQREQPLLHCDVEFPRKTEFVDFREYTEIDNPYAELEEKGVSTRIQQAVNAVVDACNASSRGADTPLSIVLAFAPIVNDVLAYERVNAIGELLQQAIRNSELEPQCKMSVVSFENKKEYQQPRFWFDINHYKPSIGHDFWMPLLQQQP